jgi:transposase-like protein
MSNRGRPTKYTPETVKRIIEAIKLGVAYVDAANYAGVGLATFNEWRDRYPEFAEAVESASGQAVTACMAKIQKAATEGSWQASAWILERRHPDRYGRTRVELTGAEGGPVAIAANVVVVPKMADSAEAWADLAKGK